MSDFKKKVLKTINKAESKDRKSRYFDLFIMSLIILNVIVIMLETVDEYGSMYPDFFENFENLSVLIFTIEYIVRVWACTAIPKYSHPFWGRMKYMVSLGALVDLIAILPFFLPLVFTMNTLLLRMLRLFRLLRIFKLGRYLTAFQLIVGSITRRKEELVIVLGLIFIMLIISSSMMYYIEHEAQPDVFTSIPATMWWGVATLTTVGYGDVYPITPLGKLLGAFIAILGIGVFALPAGIIANSFEAELNKHRKKNGRVDE